MKRRPEWRWWRRGAEAAAVAGLLGVGAVRAWGAVGCAEMTAAGVAGLEIRSAEEVTAGGFAPEGGEPIAGLPAFCRVVAVVRPAKESEIGFELWLPEKAGWNKRLEGFGSEGYAGAVPYRAMEVGLKEGYAVSGTDAGHRGGAGDARFAAGHPQRAADWAFLGVHATAQATKRLVGTFYGRGLEHAYFNGCGFGGGTQALAEAESFPQDYDGVLAGDAAPERIRLNAGLVWDFEENHEAERTLLDGPALEVLHRGAVAACDARDGIRDGLISAECRWDPKAVACKGGATAGCLTERQVEAARRIYAGPRVGKAKEPVVSGYPMGSELGWAVNFADPKEPVSADFWRWWVEGKRGWQWRGFALERELGLGEEKLGVINAEETELRNFQLRGGKLLIYHGLADGTVPVGEMADWYDGMVHAEGDETIAASVARMFVVPGAGYCGSGDVLEVTGGPGVGLSEGKPDARHDWMAALDRWVSRNIAPDQMIARRVEAAGEQPKGGVPKIQPVCPYPFRARLDPHADPEDAGSYGCVPGR